MKSFNVSVLVVSIVLLGGCANYNNLLKDESSTVKKDKEQNKKSDIAKPIVKPDGISLNELKPSSFTSIVLKGEKKEYESGEPIRFTIDMKGKRGYIYIIYEDSKGEVGLLYPNPNSPLAPMEGKEYKFPDDFGINPKAVTASKDCKDCKKDKTVIYALLTDKPILDVVNINKDILHNKLGLKPVSNKSSNTKGLKRDFNISTDKEKGNVKIGIFEFYVVK